MEYLMGIDLGSTSLKAMIYGLDGTVIASGSRPTKKYHPSTEHPEWAVWQPEQIWGDTAAAVRDAVAALDDPRHIKAVAVTGMGMDGLPIDQDGAWLYPMISWHDPRTAEQHRWWQEHITAEKVFSIGGNPLWPINSALRILWMKQHEPEIMKRADKWLLIEDFLNFMLCGERATDYSMASCTLLFDQRTLDWSSEMLDAAGIDRELMCDVHPSGTVIGEVSAVAADKTGLSAGTPVVLGGHDHLCGGLPVGAFRPGVVLDVVGTWEIVTTVTDRPILKPELCTAGMTVQAHVARGMHAIWGSDVSAGMLEWFREQFGVHAGHQAEIGTTSDWDQLMQIASAAPAGAQNVMFLPHMSGTLCPIVDDRSLGAFVGLGSRATFGDMLRAVIEGLNFQFLDIVRAMESSLDSELKKFIAVGGVTRNDFWMQNKADILGCDVEVPDIQEATPLGAAILAGIGVGLFENEQDAFEKIYRPGRVYRPDPELTADYARRFDVFRQIYPALKQLNVQLHELP